MEIGVILYEASWFLTLITLIQSLGSTYATIQITRNSTGDFFHEIYDKHKICTEDTCHQLSSGTATTSTISSSTDFCSCKCHSNLPAYREDLRICVDDILECPLAPFVGGSTAQQIPLIFLPLKNQIIYPSREIYISGIKQPICAISGAKYLTSNGWLDLRNPLDTDVPFRLFRDEGRTFLQWVGEPELHTKMSGRMILVHLMCKELTIDLELHPEAVFMPCVAFRIVGTPAIFNLNITENAFSLEANQESNNGSTNQDSLSMSEYVAIGISSVLLGLIYVASVFLYLHLKKRNALRSPDKNRRDDSIAALEEGVIKNNPLLTITHHFGAPENAYSDSNSSDAEIPPDLIKRYDSQITSAIIHAQQYQLKHQNSHYQKNKSDNDDGFSINSCGGGGGDSIYQDNSGFERLPEENVSIVETLDDRSDSMKNLTGTIRKKLYFNPEYFEPHLLMSPPPAALEFLSKIREVIAIAKQKMSGKRFTPTLLNIPEEENQYSIEPSYEFSHSSSRRNSVISLKRENSRRRSCTGCPGCESQEYKNLYGKLPALGACRNCTATNESKQRSIRKWLEDIPAPRIGSSSKSDRVHCSPKRVRSPTRSLPPDGSYESTGRALSPRPASERAPSIRSGGSSTREHHHRRPPTTKDHRRVQKPKLPPPPVPTVKKKDTYYNTVSEMIKKKAPAPLPPPDMIQEAIVMENQAEEIRIPTLTKKQMNAVINELTVHKTMLEEANRVLARKANAGYETDSLERGMNRGYQTPSEYAEISSSQPSPSLSTALPVDEEITMQNAMLDKKILEQQQQEDEDEHDYELIVMKKGCFRNEDFYNFPKILKNNNGYSLVSEVYVNNGYNFESNPSSPADSRCSTMERRALKIRYDGGAEKPGKLMIEVEDCLDHYIPINDSDEYDPDTLDRPNKYSATPAKADEFNDSLERPNQILLRSTGSFKTDSLTVVSDQQQPTSNFNRVFGSLREMFEEKRRMAKEKEEFSLENGYEGRLLTLEDRHLKRQRIKTTSKGPVVPPDVIPPPPHDNSPIYEHPKPPRKVLIHENLIEKPKSIIPKNVIDRSANNSDNGTPVDDTEYQLCVLQKNKTGNITDLIRTEDLILKKNLNNQFVLHSKVDAFPVAVKGFKSKSDQDPIDVYVKKKTTAAVVAAQKKSSSLSSSSWHVGSNGKPEDSGYLSTDSADSKMKKDSSLKDFNSELNGSETDESLDDPQSESGAESVETHSVFFGRFCNLSNANYSKSLMDSGGGGGSGCIAVVNGDDGNYSSDSETVSYTTVVPVASSNSSLIMR